MPAGRPPSPRPDRTGAPQPPRIRGRMHPGFREFTDWRCDFSAPKLAQPEHRQFCRARGAASMAVKVAAGTVVPESLSPGKVFPPLDAATFAPQLFWLALTLGLLYLLIKRLALPRVSEALEERRRHVEGDLKTAEKLRAETQLAISRYERAVAEARAEASAMAKDLRAKLAAEADAARARHDALIAQKLAEAEERIARSKARTMASVREIAGDAAAAVVTRLIGAEVGSEEVQQALVRRAAE